MHEFGQNGKSASDRRTFLKKGMVAGAATVGASLLTPPPSAFAERKKRVVVSHPGMLRYLDSRRLRKFSKPISGCSTTN